MSADRHKHPPLRFRPPEPERLWLAAYAKQTGKPVNAILTEALAAFRRAVELRTSGDKPSD